MLEIGLIGMGDMGKLYARRMSSAGWRVNVCDIPTKYEEIQMEFANVGNVTVWRNGHEVSRRSDYIIYSVEAEHIDAVVSAYGPSTKLGAIVGGQTSVKEPEIAAFEKHLPPDVHIVSCHSLHGPAVDPTTQAMVVIRHRATDESYALAKNVLEALGSSMVELSYKEHDRITADTQAVTHAAFLSMGAAWTTNRQFPWENPMYLGGIENVKINVTLRIYSNKWHVYAGLAILNPSAKTQIRQYARSVSELFSLMIREKREEFTSRVKAAGRFVFGTVMDRVPILLSDSVLDEFSLSSVPRSARVPNSHLSLLAMADCWYQLKMNPYEHMVCQTPLFRLWMGITEYLFASVEMLDSAIECALYSKEARGDDLEFMAAARNLAEVVELGSFEAYRIRFDHCSKFFAPRLSDAVDIGNRMIAKLLANQQK